MSGSQRRVFFWQLVALAIGLVTLIGLGVGLQDRAERSIEKVSQNTERARRQVAALTAVLDVLQDAETGQRGLLLTNRAAYAEPYTAATARIGPALAALLAAARDTPWLQAEAAELAEVSRAKIAELDQTVALARAGNLAAALEVVGTDRGKQLMDDARVRVIRIGTRLEQQEQTQSTLLQDRQERLAWATQLALVAGVLVLGLALMLALLNRARLASLQAAQRISGERLAATIERIRDGVAVFDRQDRLILSNARLAAVLHLDPVQARPGQHWDGLMAAAGALGSALSDWPTNRAESAEITVGSRTLEVWRGLMPGGGHILGVADISRRVAAEDIARQAQKMEVLGQMTGGVAHDFNNLLQIVSTNVELASLRIARTPAPDAWLLARLEAARGGVVRGARLTRHLLAFARRQPLAPEAIDPRTVLLNLEDMLRRTAGGATELEVVIGGGVWAVRADPNQLENALLNLTLNARDAIVAGGRPSGHITIQVNNATLDETYAAQAGDLLAGAYVVFAVTDTGVGMTADALTHATEPFYTTKPEGQGTGLGLSMVFGFAKQSGGHFELYSEVGRGTTGRLYLPRTEEAAAAAPASFDPGTRMGQGEAILLVEDDAPVRLAGAEVLRSLGYSVTEASGPDAALALLNQGLRPNLLLTDVVMPGTLTARSLAQQAAALIPGLPVLFTSGYTQNAIVHNGTLDAGVTLLSKPWVMEELARTLRRLLDAAPRPDGMQAAPPKTILVVEDEPLILMTTADTLADAGYCVLEAVDGASALTFAPQADLVVLDMGLPDMPGMDLAQALRNVRPSLPILIASGGGSPVPGFGWLPKPYDGRALCDAVAEALKP